MNQSSFSISVSEARKIILHAQGLTKTYPFGQGPASVPKTISHLGYVQLDTISVIERAHHHVLWTRNHAFQSDWLLKAQQKQRKIFEYWAHAAAFLPMEDYRFSIPVMDFFRSKKDNWPKTSKRDMKKVLDRVRAEGPLMSRDFESDHKGGTWWDWKPAKWALQRLFLEGTLMVSHRQGFQRIYGLPEDIIPEGINTTTPSTEEYYSYLITTTLRAQGLATKNEISHLRKTNEHVFKKVLAGLEENGNIKSIKVDGTKSYFTLPSMLEKHIRMHDQAFILSPFDNLIIWRKRMKEIFDFDYTLECYIPASKRKYGYFCLPVLYKDQFIGRLDLKADRQNGRLLIRSKYWHPAFEKFHDDDRFKSTLSSFAAFNGCAEIA